MKIYLVGGAVRDTLLGRNVTERDWVVVGATPQDLIDLGYTPVGKDFPVFLHPDTQEEYALARTERKTSKGYTGFEFNANENVTLEQDLERRDLTINAIAQRDDGTLIDPYHGQQDLENRVLRHVSAAFSEDPVRILRIARFAARYVSFSIHPETMALMKSMVKDGEVDALVAERVWKECVRALEEPEPQRFFSTLAECGALPILFPELPYPDAMKALTQAIDISPKSQIRFAAMLAACDISEIKRLCKRLRVPNEYTTLCTLVGTYHQNLDQLTLENAEGIVILLEKLDAFRRETRIEPFIKACQANNPHLDPQLLPTLHAARQLGISVDAKPFVEQGLKHAEIGKALHQARIEKVREFLIEDGAKPTS